MTVRIKKRVATVAAVVAALFTLAGCGGLGPSVGPSDPPASLLVVVDAPGTPAGSAQAVGSLVAQSARLKESLVVLECASGPPGTVLASSSAPKPVTVPGPAPVKPLEGDPTSFNRTAHANAIAAYNAHLSAARAKATRLTDARLASWAGSIERSIAASQRPAHSVTLDHELACAMAAVASAPQRAAHVVVTLTGVGATPLDPPPAIGVNLHGVAVVIEGFAGSVAEQAAWRGALLIADAAQVTLVSPAFSAQAPAVVSDALAGAGPRAIASTDVIFGLGSSDLSPQGVRALRSVLAVMQAHPTSNAVLVGMTDDLGFGAGQNDARLNLELSIQRSAQVQRYLLDHGIAAVRLNALGVGEVDPFAFDGPHPQARRVVVIVEAG